METTITLIKPDESREIFAKVKSISRAEYESAGVLDKQPQYVFEVWTVEYDNEKTVIHNGSKLTVYRTYTRADDRTELYTEYRIGNRL